MCVHVPYVLVCCCLFFQSYSPVRVGTPRVENQEARRLAARSSPRHNPSTEVILHSSCEYLYVIDLNIFKHTLSLLPSRTHLTTMRRREGFPFRCLGLQTASTPLRTVFNSRSRKMENKRGGAIHKDTFPRCR